MTIREEPFKIYRARSSTKLNTKEDKTEEAKKQKTHRSNDEWNSAERQPSSWSWQQPMTWASSSSSTWQEWSSDLTRECSDWHHQQVGAAQVQRVSVLDCDRRAHGSHHSCGNEERGRTFTRASMTTKVTSGCDGLLLFVISATRVVLL